MLSNAACGRGVDGNRVTHLGLFRFRYIGVAEGRLQASSAAELFSRLNFSREESHALLDGFFQDISQTIAERNRSVCFHHIPPAWGESHVGGSVPLDGARYPWNC
jgi:hypothetical protein